MDQVFTELRNDGTTLPLFIKPKNGQDSAEFIIQWIGENKELLKQKILEHGGCLTKLVRLSNSPTLRHNSKFESPPKALHRLYLGVGLDIDRYIIIDSVSLRYRNFNKAIFQELYEKLVRGKNQSSRLVDLICSGQTSFCSQNWSSLVQLNKFKFE